MSWLVANTVLAAALALVVLAVGRWLRPAPAAMHALWLFVLLKLVTPPLLPIEVDAAWWGDGVAAAPADTVTILPLQLGADGSLAPVVPVPEPAAAGTTALAPAATLDVWTLLLAAWATGSAVMLVWLAAGLRRGQRRLRGLPPVAPWLQREVHTLAASLGVRVPELRCDPHASSPYVWSFGRTRLVLPERALAAASDKGRAAVLVHELAHLRRGDHWVAHGELLLAVVLWWHPLFWFARARLRLWAELAADAWAVASVPDATIDYATVLVQAVAAPDSAVPAPAVLAARPAARAAFETRLTMILNENVPCRASRAWWLPFTSLALGLFAVPVAAQRETQDPARVELRVNGKAVDELSGAERKALLRALLDAEDAPAKTVKQRKVRAADDGDDAVGDAPAKTKSSKAKGTKAKTDKSAHADLFAKLHEHAHGEHGREHGDHPLVLDLREHLKGHGLEGLDIGAMVKQGLDEARVEIEADPELRELGVTLDAKRLLDHVGDHEKFHGSLHSLIEKAVRGATKLAEQELDGDESLKELDQSDLHGLFRKLHGDGAKWGPHKVDVIGPVEMDDFDFDFDFDFDEVVRDAKHGGELAVDIQKIVEQALRDAGVHGRAKVGGKGASKGLFERRKSSDGGDENDDGPALFDVKIDDAEPAKKPVEKSKKARARKDV